MSMLGVNSALIGAYQYAAAKNVNKADTGKISFAGQLQKTWETAESGSSSGTKQYVEYLKERYGANVMVKNVGNDQRSVDNFGASIAGYNNVVIAPNILEKMANDPEKAAYYESKIQSALNNFPRCQAELSAMGHEIYSYAVGVDENGVVHTYVTGDLKPEVRAKIEAKVKAEQEEKQKRRKKYQELSEEAAEERKRQTELLYKKQSVTDFLARQESETKTEIIVKPDGSRVLVMTMSIGGMETTMSLEISKPTEAPNEVSKQDTDNNMPSADAEMDTASDEMLNIS